MTNLLTDSANIPTDIYNEVDWNIFQRLLLNCKAGKVRSVLLRILGLKTSSTLLLASSRYSSLSSSSWSSSSSQSTFSSSFSSSSLSPLRLPSYLLMPHEHLQSWVMFLPSSYYSLHFVFVSSLITFGFQVRSFCLQVK